ncbi:MAG: hypothetical protein ABI868_23945 [Acidobacteriota bacterium]
MSADKGAGRRTRHVVLAVTWLLSAAYVWHYLDRGWWPNNAGAFSMSALRVHDGELPHRDFDEIYTGGTSLLHAISFDVLGTSMTSPRRALFLVFLTWIPSFFFVASRFASPLVAGLFTLLAATWSLPIYADPIASWYNLFLATHGLAALLRYFDRGRRRWLFIAGACGGLSVLAKIVGGYFLIAAGLALAFHEAQAPAGAPAGPAADSKRSPFTLLAAAGLAAFAVAAALGVARTVGLWGLPHLALPIFAVAAVAIVAEFGAPRAAFSARLATAWSLAWPFALGAAAAAAPFVVPYALSGAMGALVRGLFIDPQLRLDVTAHAAPPPSWAALPVLLALAWPWRWPRVSAPVLGAILAVPALLLLVNGRGASVYPAVVGAIRILLPCAAVAGSLGLLRGRGAAPEERGRSAVFAVLSVAAMCALVQLPVAETIYIYFAAPLGLLAVLATADLRSAASRALVVSAAAALLAFSVLWIDRSLHWGVDRPPFVPDDQLHRMEIDRAGGIRVSAADKAQYEELVKALRRLVARGEYIYATPDCAEVYFLAGFRNPTRTSYDFFDDRAGRVHRIQQALDEHDVKAVVLNDAPQYSGPPPRELVAWLEARYPRSREIGAFRLLWRDAGPDDADRSRR